jgi:hypothetical protein
LAAVLDTKRLGKQRVETLQIFQVLVGLRWNPTISPAVHHWWLPAPGCGRLQPTEPLSRTE